MTNKVCYWDSELGRQCERDMTPEEEAQRLFDMTPTVDQYNAPILAALEEIDAKTIRPLREGETARVAELAAQAAALRAQLRK